MTPEPKGKLDTMATQTTGGAQATMAVVAVVNGPEDELLDWHAVGWRAVEEDVRRLRQRIFTGLPEPDARKACKSGCMSLARLCGRPACRSGISLVV
jgi:RNA-directed DNA polymerase